MDINAITTLIGSLGFPIAACCALFWQMNKTNENHKLEMDNMTEALNQNTIAITKLCDRLGGGDS